MITAIFLVDRSETAVRRDAPLPQPSSSKTKDIGFSGFQDFRVARPCPWLCRRRNNPHQTPLPLPNDERCASWCAAVATPQCFGRWRCAPSTTNEARVLVFRFFFAGDFDLRLQKAKRRRGVTCLLLGFQGLGIRDWGSWFWLGPCQAFRPPADQQTIETKHCEERKKLFKSKPDPECYTSM